MNRRIAAVLLCAGLLLCATGCQLAKPEAADASGTGDRLIGVYITFEYLDTFDMEAYLSDNIGRLSGNVAVSRSDAAAYSGSIPAEQTEDGDWVFTGLDGLGYYCPVTDSEEGTHIGSHLDEGISSNKLHYITTDQGDRIEMDCTVYVTSREKQLYCNPVYQTADGQVYLRGGNGGMSSGGDHDEGELFTMTLDSESSSTVDGETTRSGGCSVTVRMSVMFTPEEIVLIQMDGKSRELKRESFVPGRLPEKLELEQDCAYVLAETRKRGPDGRAAVSRELVELREDEPTLFGSFYAGENGVCVRQETLLKNNG